MGVLNGKAIVITGSGQGIGGACAKGAARQGAAVVVNDIVAREAEETAEAIRAAGGRAIACVADVTNWDEAERLIRTCTESFGKIDGLVNNAALLHVCRIDKFDQEAARTARPVIEVNVLGPLYCAAHAVKRMVAQGSGSIVNVISGAHMGMQGLGVYGATKGAAASMVYTWALELAGTGVRVNGLSPFGTGTKMQPPDPLSQPAEANSPVIEFLLSDLSRDVNGQLVRIDREEVHLYSHPALLVPPAVRQKWTAETLADAFATEFKDRLIPCGVKGMNGLPVELQSGYWQRRGANPRD
jgi:NAD(P)-dependent dehydrogenase (short-subunit alcohol dehydrogenase family)